MRCCCQAIRGWRPLARAHYLARLQQSCGVRRDLDEARANLREAAELVLEANRALAEEELGTAVVIRELLRLTAQARREARRFSPAFGE